MPADRPDVESARFAPRAGREMAEMFDDVSGRYDLLNRVMSLGRDAAWRRVMWGAVPDRAAVVLDLCTGSGVSLSGLRQPGRLVVGADVSLQMLELAAGRERRTGWAPRLVCADAFHLPFRDAALDAITVAFGVRNLRPRIEALEELARVLKPGGVLSVLEATAPTPGPLKLLHRFYLTRLVPLAGRLSHDPTAYRYLGQSVLEFGSGPEFERDLERAHFRIEARRAFLAGAARFWVSRRLGPAGQFASVSPDQLQIARGVKNDPPRPRALEAEWRAWTGAQAVIAAALAVALGFAAWAFANFGAELPLQGWQRRLAWGLIGGGIVAFGLRTIALLRQWRGGRPRP